MVPSRGVSSIIGPWHRPYVCPKCLNRRAFATTTSLYSGHNRWSKIKHDKGKNDAVKNRHRSFFAHEIATASKMFGPEPQSNPRLADLITKAKREGFAKASIEAAVARGQGRSVSGASLESFTLEGILPNNVGVIVECETDNKARTMMDVRLVLKEAGGFATPSAYLFERRGRVVFEKREGVGIDQAMEPALETGALDVDEDGGGGLVIFTEPEATKRVADAIGKSLGLQIATSQVLWEPNEDTKVGIDSGDAAQGLSRFVDDVQEKESSVQITMNVARGDIDEDTWQDLQSRLNA